MSERAFRALFQACMHEPPHAYIQRVRLTLARNMLVNRRLLIKEIAGRLSFSSEDYFRRFFHRHTGLTPTQFRQLVARPDTVADQAGTRG